MNNIVSINGVWLWQRLCGKWDVIKRSGEVIAMKIDRQEAEQVAHAA